jgi:hypothetical protein
MPNASKLFILSDAEDAALAERFSFIVFPKTDSSLSGFQAAQRRFIQGFARLVEIYRDDPSAPVWVYMMDDDAFLHPPHLTELLVSLDPFKPLFYAEMCGGLPSVAFACGGGGILISMYNLQRAYRALQSCYIELHGPMGQYDVAISHCLANAGISGEGRPEFCSQPPSYYMPSGKGQGFNHALFLKAISFHYVTKDYATLYGKLIHKVPWWPTTTQGPAGASIPTMTDTWPRKRRQQMSLDIVVEFPPQRVNTSLGTSSPQITSVPNSGPKSLPLEPDQAARQKQGEDRLRAQRQPMASSVGAMANPVPPSQAVLNDVMMVRASSFFQI